MQLEGSDHAQPLKNFCFLKWGGPFWRKWSEIHSVVSDSLQPRGCRLPDFSVRGILQARILEWVAIPFSRGSSQPRDWIQVSHCRRILYCLSYQRSPRILEWVGCPFSSGSSWSRNQTGVSCIAAGFFTIELPGNNIIFCFKRMPACCIVNRWWGRGGQR